MRSPTVITAFCFAGILIVVYNVSAFSKLAGPYDLDIKSIDLCDDPGNGEISFSVKMKKVSKYNYRYDINWTINLVYGDESGIKVRLDVSKWGMGGWGLNAYNYETIQPCKDEMRFAPDLTVSFFTLSGIDPPACPVAPGTYYVRNWTVELNPTYFPELPYGTYKAECIILHDDVRLNCWKVIVEVTERAIY